MSDVETWVRESLLRAAAEAPPRPTEPVRTPGGARTPVTDPAWHRPGPSHAPSPARTPFPHRVLAAAVALLAAGGLGYLAAVAGSEPARPSAASPAREVPSGGGALEGEPPCATVVDLAGLRYVATAVPRRPGRGQVLGQGTITGCRGDDATPSQDQIEVRSIGGISAVRAVVVKGEVFVAEGQMLPTSLVEEGRASACRLPGRTALLGRWTSVSGLTPGTGDGQRPFRIEFETSDPRVADPWATVEVRAISTIRSEELKPRLVRRMLWNDSPETLITHCDKNRFVVDALHPAR